MSHTVLSDGYVPMLVAVHQFQYQDQIAVPMRGAFQEAPVMQVGKEIGAQERNTYWQLRRSVLSILFHPF